MWPTENATLFDPDATNKTAVGQVYETCFRTDHKQAFRCAGTIYLNDYPGSIGFEGPYPDDATGGLYVITGGTGDWEGATGIVTSKFDANTSLTIRYFDMD